MQELNSRLKKCNSFYSFFLQQVKFENKKGYVYSLYRSEIQAPDEFDVFLANLENFSAEISSRDPDFTLLLGDFKTKLKTGLINSNQLIAESNRILESSTSCINHIFTNQQNLITASAVHYTLNDIIYSKLKLKPNNLHLNLVRYGIMIKQNLIYTAIENFD